MRVDQDLDLYQNSLKRFAAELPVDLMDDPDKLEAYLRGHSDLGALFDDAVGVIRPDGMLVAGFPRLRRGVDLSSRSYFQQTLKRHGSVVSKPLSASVTGKPVIVITAPVYDREKRLVAVVMGALRLDRANFIGRFGDEQVGRTGYFFLVTRDHLVVAHPDQPEAARAVLPDGEAGALDRVTAGGVSSATGRDGQGRDVLYSYAGLSGADWVLGAAFPMSQALAPVRELRTEVWSGSAVLTVLFFLMALIGSKAIGALRAGQDRYHAISRLISDWYWEQDSELRFTRMSGDLLADTGLDLRDYLGRRMEDLPFRDTGKALAQYHAATDKRAAFHELELNLRGDEGEDVCLSLSGEPHFDSRGRLVGYRGAGSDISQRMQADLAVREARDDLERRVRERTRELVTANQRLESEIAEKENARKELAETQSRLELALDSGGIGLWDWDIAKDTVYMYRPGREITELRPMQGLLSRVHPDDQPRVRQRVTEYLQHPGDRLYENEYRYRLRNGSYVWAMVLGRVQERDENGDPLRMTGTVQEITRRKEAEQRVEYMAHYDSLTSLPNRVLFYDRLRQAIRRASRSGSRLGLLFVDLDHFKNVNDSLGHHVGDILLQAVAARLGNLIRDVDTLSRQGGDEFLILLPDIAATEDAGLVAEKIIAAFDAPFVAQGHELHVSPSVGIAVYPDDGDDEAQLIKHADIAMYQSKASGRNRYHFFRPSMDDRVAEVITVTNDLRSAADRGELFLLYQPQVDIASGRIVGVEALLRWNHAQRGLISPGVFIPIAEDTGQIIAIGDWVLRQAVNRLKRWSDQGMGELSMSVNISARQLQTREPLSRRVAELLSTAGVPAERLELEVTESSFARQAEAALAELHQIGCKMAIDDFGTGYSNLSYLKRFHIDKLKVDQAFVRDISSDPEDAAIVEAVISLARSLGMRVTAEGVETREQLGFLRDKGCDEVQGFLFSRPLPEEEFLRLYKESQGLLRLAEDA